MQEIVTAQEIIDIFREVWADENANTAEDIFLEGYADSLIVNVVNI